ncbi:MAG: transcriptional regulator [Flavobacterium psychrophilum]|jgi:AraC-like DNA-binding protein|nr:MAG: transcriptional regulator [Flavobacterium psychrophilum]
MELVMKFVKPENSLSDFVESFWMLDNASESDKEVVILPDGRIDLLLSKSSIEPFNITLLGIGTQPEQVTISPKAIIYAISFKLLAVEYIFRNTVSDILDYGKKMPDHFWDFNVNDLNDFGSFKEKASRKISSLLTEEVDSRKKKLFDLIYVSKGTLPVDKLSAEVGWSSRQINRYFNHQFGASLKTYCCILRFRASFTQIKEGKLFPELNFTDQSHFIKEVKRFSGVLPKELSKNQSDRFIQLSGGMPEN